MKHVEACISEARLIGNFDAVYEAGGANACKRLIAELDDRLTKLIRADNRRGVTRRGNDGWIV